MLYTQYPCAVPFIRDTSIRDMAEFPKQTKGHMVEKTIWSDKAKEQFGTTDKKFVHSINMILCQIS